MPVDAPTLKAWLSDGREIALLDVREHGQYGDGPPVLRRAAALQPLRARASRAGAEPLRCGWCCATAGTASPRGPRRERRRSAITNVFVLEGGVPAWGAAGYTIYAGVNVPSKVFGEIVEHRAPHAADFARSDLEAMRERGENFVIVDGRPLAEYRKMSIPGGICCPNGELVLRIRDIAPDPQHQDRGQLRRPHALDHRRPDPDRFRRAQSGVRAGERHARLVSGRARARAQRRSPLRRRRRADTARCSSRRRTRFAAACGAPSVAPAAAHGLARRRRRARPISSTSAPPKSSRPTASPGFVHAPGGQLVQATDQWVGVRARGSCCPTAKRCARR